MLFALWNTRIKKHLLFNGGRTIGNHAGVIGFLYTGMESGMVKARDADDIINNVVAGLATRALYKAETVAGAIGGIAVGLAMTGKQILKRYIPI
ncbi:mitochondrial import inner membrane translocase subunit TIM23-2 [Lactuca sativa]|uniref:mitochondrial import inner membrane translocase subunit TIM23-2 n=1 Tax=Lactuca sativa TaxID=4236 RepID=UPI000CD823B2|nr:mitochondrial import inner membrane translocase subunit TIM23-2 [Lactuca sativa]XP_052621237.1 mitochondrial import inner membrane translocase subunit TIM23-2 [Lactuca sativa]